MQEEALYARNVSDPEVQLRIAEKSSSRQVLLNLAMNQELNEETVQALFSRDFNYLNSRLESLGYERSTWTSVKGWV